jgi:hypothetical protein
VGGVLAAVIGEADEAWGVVAADVRRHDGADGPLLETVLRPVVGVQHALLLVGEGAVADAVVEHEVELTVEAEGADVAGDGAVVLVVAGVGAVAPAHRRLAHQEVLGAGGLEALADLGGEVAGRHLLDVLDRVDAQAVEVELSSQ